MAEPSDSSSTPAAQESQAHGGFALRPSPKWSGEGVAPEQQAGAENSPPPGADNSLWAADAITSELDDLIGGKKDLAVLLETREITEADLLKTPASAYGPATPEPEDGAADVEGSEEPGVPAEQSGFSPAAAVSPGGGGASSEDSGYEPPDREPEADHELSPSGRSPVSEQSEPLDGLSRGRSAPGAGSVGRPGSPGDSDDRGSQPVPPSAPRGEGAGVRRGLSDFLGAAAESSAAAGRRAAVPVQPAAVSAEADGAAAAPAAQASEAASGPPGSSRPFSLQYLLGYKELNEGFDSELEADLGAELRRVGVNDGEFQARQGRAIAEHDRRLAGEIVRAQFHDTVASFERAAQEAAARVREGQNEARETGRKMLGLATGLAVLYEQLEADLEGLKRGLQSWVSGLRAQVEGVESSVRESAGKVGAEFDRVHEQRVKHLGEEHERLLADVNAVRSLAASASRMFNVMCTQHDAFNRQVSESLDVYGSFTNSLHRKVMVYSLAGAVGGGLFGSLFGFLIYLWGAGVR